MTLSPEGSSTENPVPAPQAPGEPAAAESPAGATPPVAAASDGTTPEPAAPSAAPGPVDEDWKREVAQERAVASASAAPERAAYLSALEAAQRGDCSRLKSVLAGSQGSSLRDNAIYWQAKCLAARGDQKKAASRLDEVVTRYPKSDKAPAALWTQGQLQLRAGNSAGARGTLARLIRDYPASAEAERARKKLTELE